MCVLHMWCCPASCCMMGCWRQPPCRAATLCCCRFRSCWLTPGKGPEPQIINKLGWHPHTFSHAKIQRGNDHCGFLRLLFLIDEYQVVENGWKWWLCWFRRGAVDQALWEPSMGRAGSDGSEGDTSGGNSPLKGGTGPDMLHCKNRVLKFCSFLLFTCWAVGCSTIPRLIFLTSTQHLTPFLWGLDGSNFCSTLG